MSVERFKKLTKLLKSKKCFKLVCGAGNENVEEVEKLVYLYSKAGCNFFDISANVDVIKAAKRGIERADMNTDNFICVSVGIKGDPHVSKSVIDATICQKCGVCEKICPQDAINNFNIDTKRCIGCSKCIQVCNFRAIKTKNYPTDLEKVMPEIVKENPDCIEFHAISENESEVYKKWVLLNKYFDGMMSICVDREKLSNEKLISRLKSMLEIREANRTIIQADGAPMSGGVDDYKSTLQAVATAELVRKNNIPAYILLSGGTNSKTGALAKLCNIDINGVAIGSYARSIVKDYLFGNLEEDIAIKIAKNLVNSIQG